MAPKKTTAAGSLSLEDFRRLRVRPQEYRLAVIRRAAIRIAKGLAEKQLAEADPQAGLQLSLVATSAYRLLDPRQRQDIHHRAHVGRILPQTLVWAGQTSFCNELSGFGSSPREIGAAPFERSSLSDAELIELLDLDAPPRPKQNETPDWTVSLRDDDLLQPVPLVRRVTGIRGWGRFPRGWLAVAGLAFGAVVSFSVYQRLHSQPSLAEAGLGDPTAPAGGQLDAPPTPIDRPTSLANQTQSRQRSSSPNPNVHRSLVPDELRELLSNQEPVVAAADDDLIDSMANAQVPSKLALPLPRDWNTGDRDDRVAETGGPAVMDRSPSELEGLRDSTSPLPSQADNEATVMTLPMNGEDEVADQTIDPITVEDLAYLPDPFGPDSRDVSPGTSGPILDQAVVPADGMEVAQNPAPVANSIPLGDAVDSVAPTFAVPDQASLHNARRVLGDLMPQLELPVDAEGAERRIARLEWLRGQFPAGSPEHWLIETLVAETAWGGETVAQVERRLAPLAEQFGASSDQLLAGTFVGSAHHSHSLRVRRHLIHEGLRLADQLLLAALPEHCQEVVDAVSLLAGNASLRNENVTQYLKDYHDALELIGDYADAVELSGWEERELDSMDAKVLGRYYCLMLRRWDEGLNWLTETSDARIAGAARLELKLPEDPTAEQLTEVAGQWLAVAMKTTGRPADSIRLHAIDLLMRAKANAKALTRLEIEQQLDQARKDVPRHLLPASNSTLFLNSQRGA